MGVIDSRFQLRGGNDILYRLRAVNPGRRLVHGSELRLTMILA
jgi:hypothetical protein